MKREDGMQDSALEALRREAIRQVRALKRENAPRLSDSYWTSHTGYNYGRWAEKGFDIVLGLLVSTEAIPGESVTEVMQRIVVLARARRDAFRADADDEDGACSGAIDSAVWAINKLMAEESAPTSHSRNLPPDPAPTSEWKVWYSDMFDREMPPQVEASGTGLAKGVAELWSRFLFETVQPNGGKGFSRFHIYGDSGQMKIEGNWDGATRLRDWVFGSKTRRSREKLSDAETGLLDQLAVTHAMLHLGGRSADEILTAAAVAEDRPDFESRLADLQRSV
jgi:hypothetical protein